MMSNTLTCDAHETPRGSSLVAEDAIRLALADRLGDRSGPAVVVEGKMLKTRLREELLRQAHARLPVTYARLAERIASSVPDSMTRFEMRSNG